MGFFLGRETMYWISLHPRCACSTVLRCTGVGRDNDCHQQTPETPSIPHHYFGRGTILCTYVHAVITMLHSPCVVVSRRFQNSGYTEAYVCVRIVSNHDEACEQLYSLPCLCVSSACSSVMADEQGMQYTLACVLSCVS